MAAKSDYPDSIFEIKKEFIFEKDYKSKCMVIHAILPESERIGNDMQKSDFMKANYRYISFANSTLDDRLGVL